MNAFGTTYTVTYNLCSHTISVPKSVLTLNPEWTDCVPGISGFFDPPTTLTRGSGFKTGGPITSQPSHVHSPGLSPAAAMATQTSDLSPNSWIRCPAENKPPASIQDISQPESENVPTLKSLPDNSESSLGPPLSQAPAQTNLPSFVALLPIPAKATIGGSIITANLSSALVIASQTLAPGSILTRSGTPSSLGPNGASLILGGSSTQVLADPSSPPAYIVGSQTLVPGAAAITLSGTPISLQLDGSNTIIGSQTLPIDALIGDQLLTRAVSVVVGTKAPLSQTSTLDPQV